MISLRLRVAAADQDLVAAELWEAGTSGITESSNELRAFFDDSTDPDRLLRQFATHDPLIEDEPEHDWETEFRKGWEPLSIGRRFYLAPEWSQDPTPADRLRLTMHPGMAYGTGLGPATQLCLIVMEDLVTHAARVLDVGTGTGILAEAAVLLGARQVFGCDIDVDAAAIARRNTGESVGVFGGSLRSVRTASIQLVLANLNAVTLASLASEFKRIAPGGQLVVSGVIAPEFAGVVRALDSELVRELDDGQWKAGVFKLPA